LKVPRKKPIQISFRNYKGVNWEEVGTSTIQSFDFEIDPNLSVNELTKLFIQKNLEIFDNFAPCLTKSIRPRRIPKTVSDWSKRLIRFCNTLQAKQKRQPDSPLPGQIKSMHRTIRRSIHRDTKEHLDIEINMNGVWAGKETFFL
jgi:hypothetical protein